VASVAPVAPRRFAPEGVAYASAWNAIMVLSIANLLVAVAIGLLCAGLGYANVMRQPAQYQSTAVLLMDQPFAITKGDSGVVVKLNLIRAKYGALVSTNVILEPAAQEAGLPIGELRAAQRPSYPLNTLTMLPIARTSNPQKAQKIAQATADVLSRYVDDEQAATGIAPAERLSLRIVQNAGVGHKVSPVPSRARQVAAVAAVGGMLLAYVGLQLRSARREM
jgi:capsular polysaccharide biosynthesis protein